MKTATVVQLGLCIVLVFGLSTDRALADEAGNTVPRARLFNHLRAYPSGAIDSANDVDWWYTLCAQDSITGWAYQGTLLNKGGLVLRVYRGTIKNVKPHDRSQMSLVKQATITSPGQVISWQFQKGYYYFFLFKAAVAGTTGTYQPNLIS